MKLLQICKQSAGNIWNSSQYVGPNICCRNLWTHSYKQQQVSGTCSSKSYRQPSDTKSVTNVPAVLQKTGYLIASVGPSVNLKSDSPILQQQQRTYNSFYKEQLEDPDTFAKWHKNQMLLLNTTNDFLSTCRNSYIMTLVALSAAQATEKMAYALTISAVAGVTSELNLIFGTVFYIANLYKMWKTERISNQTFYARLLKAVLHLLLWSVILGLVMPAEGEIDKEHKECVQEDEWKD